MAYTYINEADVYLCPVAPTFEEVVDNVKVFGLHDSIRRAKYPMSTDTDSLNNELTPGIKNLAQSPIGAAHDQWLTGVVIEFDLTFSNKAWVEAERYRFLNFVSSESTMHRLSKFNFNESYNEYTDSRIIEIMDILKYEYNNETDPEKKKELYLKLLNSNPAGFKLTAGMVTNYRQFKTIYHQRKKHRLPEWRLFCKWIESLPYSELITNTDK